MKGLLFFMVKEKKSNFELMRIISMFLIVLSHIINHGHVLDNTVNPSAKLIIEFIFFLTLVHVNSFVLLTGYFQVTSTFKQSKVWQIVNANWFYRIFIMLFLTLIGVTNLDKVTFIKELLPINIDEYWFIKNYLLLYCLSPFLNKSINNFDKKSFQKLLIVLFIIFSILPTITGNKFIDNSGYTMYSFIFLYLVGSYLRLYPIDKSYLFKKLSKNMYQLILISIFIFSLSTNFINTHFFKSIMHYNTVLEEFAGYIVHMYRFYSNPLIVIQSIAYFCFFASLSIKYNKFINIVGASTFGVYLIHDNSLVRHIIYKGFLLDNKFHSYKIVFYIFLVAIIIYISCTIIELLRQKLFKYLYNLKLSKNVRNNYYNYISNFKEHS